MQWSTAVDLSTGRAVLVVPADFLYSPAIRQIDFRSDLRQRVVDDLHPGRSILLPPASRPRRGPDGLPPQDGVRCRLRSRSARHIQAAFRLGCARVPFRPRPDAIQPLVRPRGAGGPLNPAHQRAHKGRTPYGKRQQHEPLPRRFRRAPRRELRQDRDERRARWSRASSSGSRRISPSSTSA